MYLAQITFKPESYHQDQREELSDIAECYFAALLKNGQICGEYLCDWYVEEFICFTHLPRPDSLQIRHHSDWSKADLDKVLKAFGNRPEWRMLCDTIPKQFPSWKKASSFYLFTHAFDDTSSVCCGDSGSLIPIYLLPISQQSRQGLLFWASSYLHHDNIWLYSGALEIPAYQQMADPKSELSNTGRELCKDIEKATGKPTYYFLHRYWGRNDGEKSRLCPVCGGKWSTQHVSNDNRAFHEFQFRCESCRFVSHLADSYDDERHARIGEFKNRSK